MPTPTERLDAIEAHIHRTDDLLDLVVQQVARIAETTGVLGSYINAAVDYLQHHETDPDAHEGNQQ